MRHRLRLLFLFAAFLGCKDDRGEDVVVKEGRELIQKTVEYFAKSRIQLAQANDRHQQLDLLKLVKDNTQVTLDLYTGIKLMAKKYPEASKKYADTPNLLGQQLGSDLRPLFATVNKLAAEIRAAMKTHPDRDKINIEYQQLMLAWIKVLTVFGNELKGG